MAIWITLLVVGAVGLVAFQWIRAAIRDSRSIEAHRSTLDHLHHVIEPGENPIADRDWSPAPHVRVLESGQVGPPALARQPPRTKAPVLPPVLPGHQPSPPPLAPAGRRRAAFGSSVASARAMLLRSRVPLAVASAVAAITAVAVGVSLSGSPARPHHLAAPPRSVPGGAAVRVTTTTAPHAPSPSKPALVATSTSQLESSYDASQWPVQVSLAVSQRCWVELRSSSAYGPILYEGTLTAGQQRSFEEPAGLWLRLGYPPGVVLQLDGRAVPLPSGSGPFDVSVEAPAGA